MSSILKALKKIEGKRTEIRLPTWPYRMNNRESLGTHVIRSWRRQRILGVLILICAAALAGKVLYSMRAVPHNTAPETSLSADTKTTHEPTAETKSAGFPSEKDPEPAPSVSTAPQSSSPKTVAIPSTVPSTRSETEITPSAPMENVDLTLQALVWSEQPEDRFAVINGKIVREGSTVNGSIVSRIEPDYVLIRSGGTTWRLRHGQGS